MIKENFNDTIFSSNAEALINPVNCVGIMGAGLALMFRDKYEEYYDDYRNKCKAHTIKLGEVDVYQTDMFSPVFIVSFPTKLDTRYRSQLIDIEMGLESLIEAIHDYDIKSIAIPKIGCGLGGLKWELVYDMIKKKLNPVEDCEITMYLFKGES